MVDGAGPSLIARGLVDAVVVGADRVAANGDVANKIGTYPLALAAARAGVPFVVAAPESTVDAATPDGAAIEIEDRSDDEVVAVAGHAGRPARRPGAQPGLRRHAGRPGHRHRHRGSGWSARRRASGRGVTRSRLATTMRPAGPRATTSAC